MYNMEEIWDVIPGKCPEIIVQSISDAKKSHPPAKSNDNIFHTIVHFFFPPDEVYPLPNQMIYPKKNLY